MGFFQYLIRLLTAFLIVFLMLDVKSLATCPNVARTAMNYLQRYGYIDSATVDNDRLSKVLKDFQSFAGIPVTGILDADTLNKMAKPRCAVEDHVKYEGINRKKRYVLQGSRWHMNNLTYRIRNYPCHMQNHPLVDSEIARAFQLWSDVTRITFTVERREDEDPHISLRFNKGQHGGWKSFDGISGDLGYAFFPKCGGHIHFDDAEPWTANDDQGINLFQMAVHMIGHSLGLEHSDIPHSIMSPFYNGYESRPRLHKDDIVGIQSLYGSPNRVPLVIPHHPIGNPDPNGPNLCEDSSIDAATIVEDGRAFFFKGYYYWEIEDSGIVNGPRKICDDWDGMTGDINAALTWNDGKTYFFKNGLVYRFRNQERDYGYPKPIEDVFPGIPHNVDAAFVYSGNGRIYFFKDDMYWRYESCQNPRITTPHVISSYWNNLPTHMDAALTWKNQRTYFLKGGSYYSFDDKINAVAGPHSNAKYWFRCSS